MAFTSGTATDHHDLLEKLRVWAVGTLGWTQLYSTPAGSPTGTGRLSLRGPGGGPAARVFISISSHGDDAANHYHWKLYGHTDWTGGNATTPGNQQGTLTTNPPCFNLWQNSIAYWFYGTDRRIVVVAKVGSNYISSHLGFYLPFGAPASYPFPLFIAGDFGRPEQAGTLNSARRFFIDPGYISSTAASAYMRSAIGQWLYGANHTEGGQTDSQALNTSFSGAFKMWPYVSNTAESSTSHMTYWSSHSASAQNSALDVMVPTQQGERTVFAPMFQTQFEGIPGVLEGVYAVPGVGLASEGTIAVGGLTLRLFQNIQRSSGNDFMGIVEA